MTKDEAVILLCEHFSEGMVRTIVDAIAKDEALEKKDEPVAWGMETDGLIYDVICPDEHEREEGEYTIPLYTTTKRTWVGLTQEEFEKLINDAGFTRSDLLMMGACIEQIVDLVEAKLKDKNT